MNPVLQEDEININDWLIERNLKNIEHCLILKINIIQFCINHLQNNWFQWFNSYIVLNMVASLCSQVQYLEKIKIEEDHISTIFKLKWLLL